MLSCEVGAAEVGLVFIALPPPKFNAGRSHTPTRRRFIQ